jgi:S-adenosylmethionine synthetase
VRDAFDFRPASLIKTLDLKRPIYQPTAAYGHFGRRADKGLFPWERTDRAEELRKAAGLGAAKAAADGR